MAVVIGQRGKAADLVEAYFDRMPQAVTRALNRAGVSVRTLMASRVAADIRIRVGTVRDEIRISRATPTRPVVQIAVTGARIPLIEFKARGPEPSRGRGTGVRATLPAPGRGQYPHAFIATMRSGHRGVFERYDSAGKTGRRGPRGGRIYELKGPSLPRVFERHAAEGLARGEEAFLKNLEHEIAFQLGR